MTEMFGEAWSPMSVPDLAPDDDDESVAVCNSIGLLHCKSECIFGVGQNQIHNILKRKTETIAEFDARISLAIAKMKPITAIILYDLAGPTWAIYNYRYESTL